MIQFSAFAVSPIAYWNMESVDSSGRVVDVTGNGLNLNLVGDVEVMDGALDGKALHFNAATPTSRATFVCPALTNRTVSLWLKWEAGDGQDDGLPYLFAIMSGMRLHGVRATDNAMNQGTLYVGASAGFNCNWVITRGIWMHVTVVVDDVDAENGTATLRFYQNGTQRAASVGVAIGSSAEWSIAGNAHLGNMNASGKRAFNGFIDEVKIYDTALNAREVLEEYSRISYPDAVVAHWRGDREEGGVVPDETGANPLSPVSGISIVDDSFRGKALSFDGMNGTFAQTYPSNLVPRFTFAAWISAPADKATTAVDASNSGNKYPRIFQTSQGNPRIQTAPATNSCTVTTFYADDSDETKCDYGLASKGCWTHFAVTYDLSCDDEGVYSATPTYYVNGELKQTAAPKVVSIGTDGNGKMACGLQPDYWWRLGGNGGSRPFYGRMSDVWIFSRVLTADEIRQVAKGVAKVDAGADFTIYGETARLSGVRNPDSAAYPVRCELGTNAWTLVSAPEGVSAEDVVIANAGALATDVTLPEDGAYVFRLSNLGAFGIAETDTVTVTRASGSATAPGLAVSVASAMVEMPAPAWLAATVSAGVRLLWNKKSGPGGVYFSDATATNAEAIFTAAGDYVLTCTAESGGAEASADVAVTVTGNGTCAIDDTDLAAYWTFDQGPWESTTFTVGSLTNGVTPNGYTMKASKVGYGIGDAASSVGKAAYYDTNVNLPMADHMTVAYWMYHDDPVGSTSSTVKNVRTFWENGIAVQYSNHVAGPNIIAYMNNAGTSKGFCFTSPNFGASGTVPRNGALKGRWTHVAVTYDCTAYAGSSLPPASRVKFYIDGVAYAADSVSDNNSTRDADGNYVINRWMSNSHAARLGGIATKNRYFPGVLDEVRFYTNALTQAQIARLAFEFSPANRAPIVEAPASVQATAHRAAHLAGAAYDDGNGTLSVSWTVVGGEAADVRFGDAASPATSVVFDRAGTYTLRLSASDGSRAAEAQDVVCEVVPMGSQLIVY